MVMTPEPNPVHAPVAEDLLEDIPGGTRPRSPARKAPSAPAPGRLAWWKFRRHKLAVGGGIVVLLIYLVAAFAEFLAPQGPGDYSARYTYAPPQRLHVASEGGLGLYVNGYKVSVNPESFAREFVIDPESRIPVGFFVQGTPYQMWGLIPWDRHLIGPLEAGEPMFLWGADRLGRDVLSRTIYGTRISMTIGLVGVTLSLVFGILLGGLSGYYGGRTDNVIQRLIEFLLAIPPSRSGWVSPRRFRRRSRRCRSTS